MHRRPIIGFGWQSGLGYNPKNFKSEIRGGMVQDEDLLFKPPIKKRGKITIIDDKDEDEEVELKEEVKKELEAVDVVKELKKEMTIVDYVKSLNEDQKTKIFKGLNQNQKLYIYGMQMVNNIFSQDTINNIKFGKMHASTRKSKKTALEKIIKSFNEYKNINLKAKEPELKPELEILTKPQKHALIKKIPEVIAKKKVGRPAKAKKPELEILTKPQKNALIKKIPDLKYTDNQILKIVNNVKNNKIKTVSGFPKQTKGGIKVSLDFKNKSEVIAKNKSQNKTIVPKQQTEAELEEQILAKLDAELDLSQKTIYKYIPPPNCIEFKITDNLDYELATVQNWNYIIYDGTGKRVFESELTMAGNLECYKIKDENPKEEWKDIKTTFNGELISLGKLTPWDLIEINNLINKINRLIDNKNYYKQSIKIKFTCRVQQCKFTGSGTNYTNTWINLNEHDKTKKNPKWIIYNIKHGNVAKIYTTDGFKPDILTRFEEGDYISDLDEFIPKAFNFINVQKYDYKNKNKKKSKSNFKDEVVSYKNKNYKAYRAVYNEDSGYDNEERPIEPELPVNATVEQELEYNKASYNFKDINRTFTTNNKWKPDKYNKTTPYVYIPTKYFEKVIVKNNNNN